jgi:hypothetical protein
VAGARNPSSANRLSSRLKSLAPQSVLCSRRRYAVLAAPTTPAFSRLRWWSQDRPSQFPAEMCLDDEKLGDSQRFLVPSASFQRTGWPIGDVRACQKRESGSDCGRNQRALGIVGLYGATKGQLTQCLVAKGRCFVKLYRRNRGCKRRSANGRLASLVIKI